MWDWTINLYKGTAVSLQGGSSFIARKELWTLKLANNLLKNKIYAHCSTNILKLFTCWLRPVISFSYVYSVWVKLPSSFRQSSILKSRLFSLIFSNSKVRNRIYFLWMTTIQNDVIGSRVISHQFPVVIRLIMKYFYSFGEINTFHHNETFEHFFAFIGMNVSFGLVKICKIVKMVLYYTEILIKKRANRQSF